MHPRYGTPAVALLPAGHLSGVVGQQNGLLVSVVGLLLLGVLRVWRGAALR